MANETKDIRLTRTHSIYQDRIDRLLLNQLAVSGGANYIDRRLTRLPFESDASWTGAIGYSKDKKIVLGKLPDSSGSHETGGGRKARAFLINYAARICAKINQYVFSTEVKRDNADAAFLADATRTGMSLNDLMRTVSTTITSCRWCWLGIDRMSTVSNGKQRSQAEKEIIGDRIYWTYWHPTEVVDWCFGRDGQLLWLITEQEVYENEDLLAVPKKLVLRTIWRRGEGTRIWVDREKDNAVIREEEFAISAKIVPFVLIGFPSKDAWWFDDVEMVQSSLLNLDSVHGESLFQSVYPQLVLPADLLASVQQALKCSGEEAVEIVRGLNYPLLEPQESNGQTRYIMPPADGMVQIPTEITRRRRELFDIVGLAMQNPDTRQVASAEAKAWDHLDPEAVLKERAIMLEEAEEKAVAISRQLDNTFQVYAPQYGKRFSVSDIAQDIQAIIGLNNLDLPFIGRQEVQKAAVQVLDKMIGIPEKRKMEILAAIDAQEEPEPLIMQETINRFAAAGQGKQPNEESEEDKTGKETE